ncbi:MAG: peptide deformylase [Muribaculaceae bacterium]|nr:peptide deformylase [Muribaculaceae bacterium]
MILPIYIYGHPVLRADNVTVTPDFPNLTELITNMKETMYHTQGIGIAAPQVGVNARIVYIDVDVLAEDFPELKDVRLVLINPTITIDKEAEYVTREEGCLSVPGIHENVQRIEKIHLHWQDENFEEHDQDIEGYLARVVQHECDHLDKTLFVDRISPIRKQLIRSKLNNMVKGKVSCDYRCKVAPIKRKK